MTYIIESIEEPRRYWHDSDVGFGWINERRQAREYNQAEREVKELPAHGCWVQVTDPPRAHQRENSAINHFTTIKLRPVAIRLLSADGEYEDLNAQALEFEAAVRQWVKGQQILPDGWMVDVITEEE